MRSQVLQSFFQDAALAEVNHDTLDAILSRAQMQRQVDPMALPVAPVDLTLLADCRLLVMQLRHLLGPLFGAQQLLHGQVMAVLRQPQQRSKTRVGLNQRTTAGAAENPLATAAEQRLVLLQIAQCLGLALQQGATNLFQLFVEDATKQQHAQRRQKSVHVIEARRQRNHSAAPQRHQQHQQQR